MVKEINLSVPTDWNDITLRRYLRLQKELASYGDDEEATVAVMMSNLCGLPAEYLHSIGVDDYNLIRETLTKFISNYLYSDSKNLISVAIVNKAIE